MTTRKFHYCGNPGANFRNVIGFPKPAANGFAWFDAKKAFPTTTGRTAIQRALHLLQAGPDDEVLIPSYNCGSEIDPLYKSGARVTIYRIDRDGRVDFNDVKRKISGRTRIVYQTHYFGFMDDAVAMQEFCRRQNLALIEDCALSLFSETGGKKAGSFGNVAVFSVSKTLPFCRGGILVVNDETIRREWRMHPSSWSPGELLPLLKTMFFETLEGIGTPAGILLALYLRINSRRIRAAGSGAPRPPIADEMFFRQELNDLRMPALSRHMFRTINCRDVVEKRRRNFLILLDQVRQRQGISHFRGDLPDGACPLFFPILVEERTRCHSFLLRRMIDAPRWWFGYHPSVNWDEHPDSCYLKDHLLQLPVHHRLGERAMQYIADQVNGF
jgi:dTDP-4-amino-4,6-dideoxygalactose transaminase